MISSFYKYRYSQVTQYRTQHNSGQHKTHCYSAHRLWRRALEPGNWKQCYKHLKFQITHKLMTKSRHNLTKSKILGNAASPMQSELCLQVFSLPFTLHRRCNIFRKKFFVRLCSEFIVNLWENWNLGCFTNCFQDSGSSARLHSLCALFQCVLRRPELCYDFECPKILKFWEGSVHTSILTICVCFSNCCFGILMTRSFSFKQLFDELIRAVSVWIPACSKEASGNTLHHHICKGIGISFHLQLDAWRIDNFKECFYSFYKKNK